MGKPGRGKSLTFVIGPSGGRCAAKTPWEPVIQHPGGNSILETYRPPEEPCPRGEDGPPEADGVLGDDRAPSTRGVSPL